MMRMGSCIAGLSLVMMSFIEETAKIIRDKQGKIFKRGVTFRQPITILLFFSFHVPAYSAGLSAFPPCD